MSARPLEQSCVDMRKLTNKKNTHTADQLSNLHRGFSECSSSLGPIYARGWLKVFADAMIDMTLAIRLIIKQNVSKSISIGSPFYQQGCCWISGSPYNVHIV
nr:MAG TPA: hypothetical protein [Caudoviricetes sp.]